MYLVRPFREEDRPAVHELYLAQRLPYAEIDWAKCEVSAVLKKAGEIQMAAFLRKTAEVYLLLDPNQKTRKRDRLGELIVLHKELLPPALASGLTDVHCWIPPQLGDFGPLLENPAFGWTRTTWPGYVKEIA